MARIRSIDAHLWKPENDPWGFARTNLYLIQEGKRGAVKVGIAGHPMRRLGTLQCGNPRQLHLRCVFEGEPNDCVAIEVATKKFFQTRSVRGEWIRAPIEEMHQFIRSFEVDR